MTPWGCSTRGPLLSVHGPAIVADVAAPMLSTLAPLVVVKYEMSPSPMRWISGAQLRKPLSAQLGLPPGRIATPVSLHRTRSREPRIGKLPPVQTIAHGVASSPVPTTPGSGQ